MLNFVGGAWRSSPASEHGWREGGEAPQDFIGKNLCSVRRCNAYQVSVRPVLCRRGCGGARHLLPPLHPCAAWLPPWELILHRHSVSGSSSFHFRGSVINSPPRRNKGQHVCTQAAPRHPDAPLTPCQASTHPAAGRRPQRSHHMAQHEGASPGKLREVSITCSDATTA